MARLFDDFPCEKRMISPFHLASRKNKIKHAQDLKLALGRLGVRLVKFLHSRRINMNKRRIDSSSTL